MINWKRSIKFFFQRIIRGFDDSETWNLDARLAEVIVPRLKRYKELTKVFPPDLTWEEWHTNLDQMIKGFEWFAADCNTRDDNYYTEAHKGIELFAKFYGYLWW